MLYWLKPITEKDDKIFLKYWYHKDVTGFYPWGCNRLSSIPGSSQGHKLYEGKNYIILTEDEVRSGKFDKRFNKRVETQLKLPFKGEVTYG